MCIMPISINASQISILLFCFAFLSCSIHGEHHNYEDALAKSILYFQAQRSGKLPPVGQGQDVEWRGDSGLSDGLSAGVDLTGGYYDAGDNVKFNFPMAFTTTMLSWGAMEYGKRLGDSELENMRAAIRWGTDYLLKCALATPGKLYVGVGNPVMDHSCWQRPEDMDTDRSVYSVTVGSDVAGETAAALAAASIVFRKVDWAYSRKLLKTAKYVMDFAMADEGEYSDQLGNNVCPFYCSVSGYKDELLWGAAWLLRATGNVDKYLNLIQSLGNNVYIDVFGWDNKYAGALVLLTRRFLLGNDSTSQQYSHEAEKFLCKILPESPYSSTRYTPGGLMYKIEGGNLQYVTGISFLMTTYAKYMARSKHTFKCGGLVVTRKDLRSLVKKQVDYILGDNPEGMSYMVGYGNKYPKNVHHRGASMPSIKTHPQKISCTDGFSQFLHTSNPDANVLTGAIVGGPNTNDEYDDDRAMAGQSEPSIYYTAPLVGTLAYLAASDK